MAPVQMSDGSAGSGGSDGGMSEAGSDAPSDIFGPASELGTSSMPRSPSAASIFSADDESALSEASSDGEGEDGLPRSPGESEYESEFPMDDDAGDDDDMLQELEDGMDT